MVVNLLVNYDIGKSAEEFDKEVKALTKKSSGFNWKSLSDSCGGCAFMSAIILAIVFVIAVF